MTYTVRHIGTVTVQAESEAALEAMLLSYWTPQSVGKVREAVECPGCEQMKTTVERRRRNTAYADDASNFLTVCRECQDEDDAYYAERWADYYAGCL